MILKSKKLLKFSLQQFSRKIEALIIINYRSINKKNYFSMPEKNVQYPGSLIIEL
jgi:hypothetical protein